MALLQDFLEALHACRKVRLGFYSKKDGALISRVCAPLDYGPSRIGRDVADRYHLWDYESPRGRHPLQLLPEQVHSLEILTSTFDPAVVVTWEPNWCVQRDW